MSTRSASLLPCLAAIALAPTLAAEDDYFVGPRALGMAGANVASTDDQNAQYYNPAAFGFFRGHSADGPRSVNDTNDVGRKSWGFGLDATADAQVQGRMAQYIDTLSSVNYQSLSQNGIQNLSDLQNLVKLADALGQVDSPGNALTASATAGYGMRIGHWGLGVRVSAEASARVNNVDLSDLGLSGANINSQIQNSGATGDGQIAFFSPAQVTQLQNAGLTNTSIQVLDYLARQQNVSPSDASQMVNLLSQISQATNGGAGGPLSANTTSVLIKGFGLAEVPLTYGHELTPHLSVGATLKLMIGRVYGNTVLVFQNNIDQQLRQADKNYKQTVNVGVDAGAIFRIPHLEVGLTGRNLNGPTFAGPTVAGMSYGGVRCNPTATLGVAIIPFRTFVLESDVDLNKAETTLDGYYEQRYSAGAELNLLHFLALRGGVYRNLAVTDSPWVGTGGLGVNLWAMRLDLAGAYSFTSSTFEGHRYPHEAAGSLGLMVDF